MDQAQMKQAVARAAVEYIDHKLTNIAIVGIGTGSTANYFIEALAAIKHKFDGAVASSVSSATRLKEIGVQVYELNVVDEILVYVDGADESTRDRQLIKGGGGALTREKILAAVSTEFVCIVDTSKVVDVLGAFPLPVEVIPMARGLAARALASLGGSPELREGFVTDNGNIILDVHELKITNPATLETAINNIVGVVGNGVFAAQAADVVFVASAAGVQLL